MTSSARSATWLLLAGIAVNPACYDAHGRHLDEAGDPDAGAHAEVDSGVDAGGSSGPRDGGSRSERDATIPHGERPSEAPEAADWETPPEPRDGPCCELVGDRIPLTDPGRLQGPADVAWNGDGWGIALARTPDEQTELIEVTVDGRVRSSRVVAQYDGEVRNVALAAGLDSYGLWRPGEWRRGVRWPGVLVTVTDDPAPYPAHEMWESGFGDLSYVLRGHRWLLGSLHLGGDADVVADITLFDGAARPLWTQTMEGPTDRIPRSVALRSLGAVVLSHDTEGVSVQAVDESGPIGGPTHLMDSNPDRRHWIAAAALRDHVVVARLDGTELATAVFDPFSGTIASPERSLFTTPSQSELDAAGTDKRGFVAICYPDNDGPATGSHRARRDPTRVMIALVGGDGELLARPVRVAENDGPIGGGFHCAVGIHGDRIAVAYWDQWDSRVWFQLARVTL